MTVINSVTTLDLDGDVAVITLNSPPVNALSAPVREGLYEGFKAAGADASAKAIVLVCEGRTFIAGADIAGFGSAPVGPSLADVQVMMENSPKPVIAAIHGTALGGGLEVALCAHYRVAVPSAKVGLPEVNLGLIPGAGGTQRLPRIVGAEKALDMVTSGAHVPAKDAAAMGLVDELVEEGKLRAGAIAFARKVLAEGRPLRRVRDNDDKVAPARGHPEIFANFRKANARKFRGFMAPEHNIRAVEAAVNLPFDQGIAEERRLFEEVMASPHSAAQRYAFFAERAANKIPDVADDTQLRAVKTVGILGAGTMGGGIAISCLKGGLTVTVVEMKPEALERGLGIIRATIARDAERGTATKEQVEQRLANLKGSLDMADFKDVDLVIEAVFEDMNVKKDVFKKLDAICKPGAILASNTSYLNVDEIAAATSRPGDVIGMHFFSPANIMKLLEVVRGAKTAKDVLATVMRVGKQIGKVPVVAGVCPGFIGNRMLRKRGEQAEALVLEGADPIVIDKVFYDFGFPMGPFQMMDVVGMDVIKDQPGERSLRGAMYEAGRLGQKGIGGFYDYDANRNQTPSPEAVKIVEQFRKDKGATVRAVSEEEILDRSLLPVINEGAKVLQEGIAIRSSDIDTIWLNGYGWPVYRGGPMYYADQLGLKTVVEKLKQYQAKLGDDWKPAPLLEKLAAEGKGFADFKR